MVVGILSEALKRTSTEYFSAIVGLLCFLIFVPLSSQLSFKEIIWKNYGFGENHIKMIVVVHIVVVHG